MRLDFRKSLWQSEAMAPAKAFVRACMVPDRASRPTAMELLTHAWLSGGAAPAAAPEAKGGGVNAAFVEMLDETVAIESGEKKPPPATGASAAAQA